MEFRFKAQTNIWTGGVDRQSDKVHPTGIKGSIRWWYEVLMRGMGLYVCDPRSDDRCSPSSKDAQCIVYADSARKMDICPACYLFGCTNWSSKINFNIMSGKIGNQSIHISPIEAGDVFMAKLVERKLVDIAEKQLLQMTLRVIVDYGALGGKTTLKPSEISSKNAKFHHKDYGIVTRGPDSNIPMEALSRDEINKYLAKFSNNKRNHEDWPDLRNFWFVKGKHLHRVQHNMIVGRNGSGNYSSPSEFSVFLGGFINREKNALARSIKDQYAGENAASKKIFSFHGSIANTQGERCYGYTRNAQELTNISIQLTKTIPDIKAEDIIKGEDLLKTL